MAPTIDALLARLDGKKSELVTLTQELVAFPTINPPGDAYEPCARYLGDRLAKRGFQIVYERALGTPGDNDDYPRINVIARWEATNPGPTIHFNGHIDVVEVGHGWTLDPWAGEIRDGKVFGRGTCDMKGGLAAAVIAVETLIEQGLINHGALEVSGTVDEESGGFGGVAYLAGMGYFSRPRVDHVIIPEPLNVDRVCIGHRGVWWAEIETLGRISHGSMPFLGNCAVRHMGAVLNAIESELLPELAKRQTAMPVVPDGARQSTLNINAIHGGMMENFEGLPSPCVPDSCRMTIDRRFLIEEDHNQVKSEFIDLLDRLRASRHGFDYRIKDIMKVMPIMTEPTAPVPQAVAAAVESVLGKPAEFIASPGTYDQKHIARIGHLHDCVAYGPGILDLAHQPDEFVAIDDLVSSAKVMAMAVLKLLELQT